MRRGMTLIELMIVISIIAVLMAVLLPNFVSVKYQAVRSACIQNERAIASALEIYRTDFSRYPNALGTIFSEKYLNQRPVCPSNGAGYEPMYSVDQSIHAYTVGCPGIHFKVLKISPGYPQYSSSAGVLEQ